jgi:hypothetical protein
MGISRLWRISVAIMVAAASPMAASIADPYLIDRDSGAFVLDHSQLRNWRADGERGIWMQADDLRWFYARFAHTCHGRHTEGPQHAGGPAASGPVSIACGGGLRSATSG